MSEETEEVKKPFAKGVFLNKPFEGSPKWKRATLSITPRVLVDWLKETNGLYLNKYISKKTNEEVKALKFTIKEFNGELSIELETYGTAGYVPPPPKEDKPKSEPAPSTAKVDDDLPF